MSPAAALAAALDGAGLDPAGLRLGVAVSGGGDSVALLVLAAEWAAVRGVELAVATVDHGLRPEAAQEAAAVADLCARLGLPHVVLPWDGAARRGNLQAAARSARQRLLAGWAAQAGLGGVMLGHTLDDQAETVLMRLARGSGVDGLAAMAPVRRLQGVLWLRPLLTARRAALRGLLCDRGLAWAEDPLNADGRFQRVRARRALARLAGLGIDAAGLAATAARMGSARAVLAAQAQAAADRLAVLDGGDVLLPAADWAALPEETRARLLVGFLVWIGAAAHPPRRAALERLIARLLAGQGGTLHGVRLTQRDGWLRLLREARALRGLSAPPGALWDGRWRLIPPEGARLEGLHLAALGPEGLAACPDWRATGRPRASLVASPAVWQGPWLVAAPLAGLSDGWRAALLPDRPAAVLQAD